MKREGKSNEVKRNEQFDNLKWENKTKTNAVKKQEVEVAENKDVAEKSKILKLYLQENLIPILAEGIKSVCNTLPSDPVDHLAIFLFEKAHNVPFKDPSKYNQ